MPILIGIFVVVFILFVFKRRTSEKKISFDALKEIIKDAKASNHIIKARLLETSYVEPKMPNAPRVYTSYYVYEVDGKRKKKLITSTEILPPDEIDLYYVDTPEVVYSWYDAKA